MRPLRAWITASVAALAFALSLSAAAEGVERVHVVVAASADDARRFEQSLRELLGRLGVEMTFEQVERIQGRPVSGGAELLVRVDLTGADRVKIQLLGKSGTESERDVPVGASRAVVLDESAHVVQAAVESLLAEEATRPEAAPKDRATPAPNPEPTAAPPPTHESARENWGLDGAAMVGLHVMRSDAVTVPGVGVGLNAAYRNDGIRPGVWFTAEYRFPFDIDDSVIPPQARTLSLRLMPSIDVFRAESVAVQVALGAGFDRFDITHNYEDAQDRAHPSKGTQTSIVLSGLLALRVGVVKNVQFTTLLVADLDPDPPDLEIRPGYPVASYPWNVRPGLMFGISFTPLGAEPIP